MPAFTSSRYAYEGIETTETSIVRIGGASDPTGQQQSRKIATTANSQWLRPFKAEPYAIWNSTTGANVTVTVCGISNADGGSNAAPNNDDIWMECEFLGSSSSPLGTIVNTTKANLYSANAVVASDSSTWNNASVSYSIWESATATAVTLSGGNLVATNTGTTSTSQGAHVAAASSKTTGKYYFEGTFTTIQANGGDYGIGFGTPASTYNGMGSTGGVTGSMVFKSGNIYTNGGTSASLGARANGDVIGVAVDFDNRMVWYRVAPSGNWNNSGTANPATNTGGLALQPGAMVPFVTFGGASGIAGNVITANFGASAFTGAVPSGFASGWTDTGFWSPFKLTTTLSSPQPGMAGYLNVRVRAAKASAVYYIDPKIELTASGGVDNAPTTAYKSSRYAFEGTETTETSITRVGGAVDPTGQAQSRKIVTTANSQWLRPFRAEPYAIWNPTAGANVTVTVYGTINAGAVPNNDDIWMECEFLGSSSFPIGTIVATTKANLYSANAAVASDSSTWNVPAFTTWNPSDLVSMTLSNNNLTATNTTTPSGVRTVNGFASGKYYWEVTLSTWAQTATSPGFGLASAPLSPLTPTGTAVLVKSGSLLLNNVGTGITLGVRAAGDIIGIALDIGNNLCWFRVAPSGNWNGSGTANPATGVGGLSISTISGTQFPIFLGNGSGEVATANFGGSAFSGTVPSGFTSGWPAVWSPFKLTTTLSSPQPGMAGYLYARVRAAKASTTYYIDPQIVLS